MTYASEIFETFFHGTIHTLRVIVVPPCPALSDSDTPPGSQLGHTTGEKQTEGGIRPTYRTIGRPPKGNTQRLTETQLRQHKCDTKCDTKLNLALDYSGLPVA